MITIHKPVLLREAIDALNIKRGGTYIDATFGFGGHSKEILKKIGSTGKLIGFEKDKQIYVKAKNLYKHNKNLSIYNRDFIDVSRVTVSDNIGKVDGILFDLGINLYQIKESGKGFSFLTNEKLDMRIDDRQGATACDIVNSCKREDLEDILWIVGERRSRAIARAIYESRRKKKIETTFDLVKVVESVKKRTGKAHPATLTFMALRIEVNREMEVTKKALEESLKILKPGGRIVVITFHSGEDRLVKNIFKQKAKEGIINIINKKVIVAQRSEILSNPPSRSAKLRVVELI